MKLTAFKAYDVRGRIPDEINKELARAIGRAYAGFVKPRRVIIGRDIRLTSATLAEALIEGLLESGVSVADIGLCGTEGVYYATAKAGVIALARCCAEAFAPHNVRVNCIAPGLIDTEMARVLSPTQIDSVLQQTPLARLGTPEEISELACFLLSERASFIVGQTISACGGRVTLP